MLVLKLLFFAIGVSVAKSQGSQYFIGTGIADVTGAVADIGMMGYANPSQHTEGIHFRLYSRAFIVDDGKNRVVFVSVDMCMIDQLVKIEVINRLQKFGGLYHADNVVLSAIHTHSGAGGFSQYVLLEVTTLGFIKDAFNAYVTGIVRSIERAHSNMKRGRISHNMGELLDASINRSPSSYLANPDAERQRYKYDTDKEMLLLRFDDENGRPLGSVNWFAVHPTSMNNTNYLISGDNKGHASQLFEGRMNPGALPGKGPFVAAFASTNLGDVSPNILGPHCLNSGLPCDFNTSTCNGKNEFCVAFGPGKDMVDSTRIIGERQFIKAWDLYNGDGLKPISGPVTFQHQFVDMTAQSVEYVDPYTGVTIKGRTCKPSLGYSFAAGTIDGPGMFDFKQGETKGNIFWNTLRNFLKKPSKALQDCQQPKPILLATGEMSLPYSWHPEIVETQIIRIGNLFILAVPGEFTTMAGRRLRDAVKSALLSQGAPPDTLVVIAGLSNVYTHYIATFEEYQVQRYEGASTIYGPHSHAVYVQQYKKLAAALMKNQTLPTGPQPHNLKKKLISFQPGVIFDSAPMGKTFGQCIIQPYPEAYAGEAIVTRFVSGHPRNNPMQEASYLTVDKLVNGTSWTTVATDSNWDTSYHWVRTNMILGHSEAEVTWHTLPETEEGTYRICVYGYQKPVLRKPRSYSGCSQNFRVVHI